MGSPRFRGDYLGSSDALRAVELLKDIVGILRSVDRMRGFGRVGARAAGHRPGQISHFYRFVGIFFSLVASGAGFRFFKLEIGARKTLSEKRLRPNLSLGLSLRFILSMCLM